jgi:hypothetical protein
MQADGFVMGGEHVPLWSRIWGGNRPLGYLRRSHIEAAARLALWEDFDCKSFDALCVSLVGEETNFTSASEGQMADLYVGPAGGSGRALLASESHGLLRTWLLCISEELLDPRLGQEQELSLVREEMALNMPLRTQSSDFVRQPSSSFAWVTPSDTQRQVSAKITRSSGAQKRFAYFVDKVCPLQVWRDDGGALFLQLKTITQRLMDGVAFACNERYSALVTEPCGRELSAFFSLNVETTMVQQLLFPVSSSLDDDWAKSKQARCMHLWMHYNLCR